MDFAYNWDLIVEMNKETGRAMRERKGTEIKKNHGHDSDI